MSTGNTALLGLALPVEGELEGTWGDVVNDSITSLVDSAIAGTTTLSVDADATLTDTNLEANQARQAVLLWTASNGATTRNITAPARSKPYIVINAGTGSVVLRGAGPTTGVTVVANEKCLAAWNGSDFVKIATSVADGVTSVGGTGTVNGITLTGAVTSSGNLTLGGTLDLSSPPAIGSTTASTGAFTTLTTSSTVTHNGGTANGVAYLNGSKALTTGSALTFDGTNLGVGVTNPSGYSAKFAVDGNAAVISGGTLLCLDSTNSYYYQIGANGDSLAFSKVGLGELMRLTSTGLGIGTSSSVVFVDNGGTQANPRLLSAISSTNTTRTSQAPALTLLNSSSTLTVGRMARLSFAAVSSGIGSPIHSADITAVFTSGATGNGVSSNLIFSTTDNTVTQEPQERMRLDSSGNLGLGVTPSAWGSNFKVMQFGAVGSISENGFNDAYFATNWRFDGTTSRYIVNDWALQYAQQNGEHLWLTAPSGTAGDAISFTQAMTLTAAGDLGVGGTSPYARVSAYVASSGTFQNAFGATNGVNSDLTIRIKTGVTDLSNSALSAAISFSTENTERARIDSSGNLLVNTTSVISGAKLSVSGSLVATGGISGGTF